MAIFSAFAKFFAAALSSIYFASFPSSMVFAFSKSPCLMEIRACKISLNRWVYFGPNSSSATMLEGCMLAISRSATSKYIPGSA